MMKAVRIATIALCMALLVLPSLAIPIFRSRDDGAENRTLAEFPELTIEDEGLNQDFDTEFESWLCDHFALRKQAVRLNALMNYRLLHTSPNDQVIPGAHGWLYFAETVPDYTGAGRLTDGELETISENLRLMAQALAERGARLFVAVVPNKNTVYPENMPGRYAMREDDGNIARMEALCEGLPLTWIDLSTPLKEAAAGEALVYCRTDTHWNALGAAIAAKAILSAMGRDAGGYAVDGEADFSGGDLARLMGVPDDLTERVPNVVPDEPLPEADYSEHLLTAEGGGEGALVVYRDSFGTAIGPWLAGAYGQTELRWRIPLDATRPCDDALVLICERNLRQYLLSTPVTESEEDEAPSLPHDTGNFTAVGGDYDFFSDDEEDEDEATGEWGAADDDFFSDDEEDGDDDDGEWDAADDDFFSDDEEDEDLFDEEAEEDPLDATDDEEDKDGI